MENEEKKKKKKTRHVMRDLGRPAKMRQHRSIRLTSGELITRHESKKRTKKRLEDEECPDET
ncbi:MAG: hypothetical protein ACXACF_01130 [Candidatus Hermodarchaeia archaeon]|jgi:hypothetical protein